MASLLRNIVLALPLLAPVHALPPWGKKEALSGKAVYTLTNKRAGNDIIAIPIGSDGMLQEGAAGVIPTGGKGWTRFDPATSAPAKGDALISQNSVVVAGDFLFAVNAMSNTVTMFQINARNATDLFLMSQSKVPGDFPTTVDVSLRHSLVCVGTTGHTNGVTCANFDSRNGIGQFDALRSFDLDQTTPPVGPPNTASQVQFTADEKFLIATVKGDPTTMKQGYVAAFALEGDKLGKTGVRSQPEGTLLPFGFNQIPGTNDFIITDPSIGAVHVAFDPVSCKFTTVLKVPIDGQKATCWSAISLSTSNAYLTDGGLERIEEYNAKEKKLGHQFALDSNAGQGQLDVAASDSKLYSISPGNGQTKPIITVVDQASGRMVQKLDISKFGGSEDTQGMAILF